MLASYASQLENREHTEPGTASPLHINGSDDDQPLSTNDLFLKDAFLVFRAMCKLTMKPLNTERYAHDFLCILFHIITG